MGVAQRSRLARVLLTVIRAQEVLADHRDGIQVADVADIVAQTLNLHPTRARGRTGVAAGVPARMRGRTLPSIRKNRLRATSPSRTTTVPATSISVRSRGQICTADLVRRQGNCYTHGIGSAHMRTGKGKPHGAADARQRGSQGGGEWGRKAGHSVHGAAGSEERL